MLAAEFAITVSDGEVWRSVAVGLLFGGVCLLFGTWVARRVGLLGRDAPAAETVAVGLTSGLLVLAAWWAAIGSGGRSSFTPVAIGFTIAIGLALVRPVPASADDQPAEEGARGSNRNGLLLALVLSGAFIVAVALLYGSTMAPSPRDGVQPVESMDQAYYSIFGADLADTGTETIFATSGFSDLDGLPPQTWYHWGEMWLASAVIKLFGLSPLDARHFVVLPVLLLAAAALTGTLVRRVARTGSRRAFIFGFLACLLLAPVPFVADSFFGSWAVGLIFGMTLYGLAAVVVLLAIYAIAVFPRRQETWALAGFAGSAAAMILPAHLVIAGLAIVGIGGAWVFRRTPIARGHATVATHPIGLATHHHLDCRCPSGHGRMGPAYRPRIRGQRRIDDRFSVQCVLARSRGPDRCRRRGIPGDRRCMGARPPGRSDPGGPVRRHVGAARRERRRMGRATR